MSKEHLSMHKVKEVLRLRFERNLSYRAISSSCRISIGTVHDYLARCSAAGLAWPLALDISDEALERRLFPAPPDGGADLGSRLPDWNYVAKEIRRKGVTLALLWDEYIARRPDGIGYSHYCRIFREFRRTIDPRMRQVHKAGDKLFVDYAGMTMPVVDRKNGEIRDAQIFVAAQGCSSYTFAEATWTQSKPDWLGSHVRAFEFYGGAPKIVVPDNAKAGVTSPHFYEPDLNRSYLEMAVHYGVAVVPARPAKPRDKPKVESAVQIVERRVLAPLRNRRFLSLGELNEAMAPLLDQLNDSPFQKLDGTRRQLFEEIDLPALRPLPECRYVFSEHKKARVNVDYHVDVDRRYYSVPHTLIKKEVDVRISARTIEVFHKGERVASHVRLARTGEYSTLPGHMPPAHQAYAEWTPERFLRWAREVGGSTGRAIEQMLARHAIPEQSFRACMGVMRLGGKYGAQRLEAACSLILTAGTPSYKSIDTILRKGMDAVAPPQAAPVIDHANIRGAAYYATPHQGEPQTPPRLLETERQRKC